MWRICRSRRPRRRPRRRRSRPRCRRLTRRRPRLRTRPAFRAGASCLARRASVLRRRRTRRWRRTPSPPPSPSLLRAWSRSFARWQWHACGQEWATKATGPPRLLGHQGYWATKAAPVQEWLVGLGPQGLCGPRSRRAGVYPPPLTSCCAPFVRSQVISTCVTGCKYRTEHRQRKALMRRKSMRDVSAFSGFTGEGTQGAGAGAGAFAGSLTLGDAQGRSLSNFTKAAAAPGAAPAVSEIVQAV